MSTAQIEDRLSEIEAKLSELSNQVTKLSKQNGDPAIDPKSPWWERFVGIFENDPAFEEAERLRLEYRASLDRKGDEGLF